jgi:hypothetical protein
VKLCYGVGREHLPDVPRTHTLEWTRKPGRRDPDWARPFSTASPTATKTCDAPLLFRISPKPSRRSVKRKGCATLRSLGHSTIVIYPRWKSYIGRSPATARTGPLPGSSLTVLGKIKMSSSEIRPPLSAFMPYPVTYPALLLIDYTLICRMFPTRYLLKCFVT